MEKPKPIRLGIIGCGSFIQRRILPFLHELEEIKVICIQKRNIEKARELAEIYHIPHAVDNREELLQNPEVDAVLIATQNHLHEEDALASAQAGKPTLCEKPLAPTSEAIKRMLAAFRQRRLPFFVGHSLRFKPAIQKAKELLQNQEIGTLRSMRAFFSISVPANSWKRRKETGGGVLQDIGIHLIDLIHFISGEKIERVSAIANIKEVEETICAFGVLTNGAFISFECSFEEPVYSGFEIIGSKGRLISCHSLRQTFDPIETLSFENEKGTFFYPLRACNIYVEELKHIAKCLRKDAFSLIPADIAFENQKVLEALTLSYKQKKEIAVF